MYGKHGPPAPVPPAATGQFVFNGRPTASEPSSSAGFTWLASITLYRFTPWLPTYASCNIEVEVISSWRFKFQFSTYGVLRFGFTANMVHWLARLHDCPAEAGKIGPQP